MVVVVVDVKFVFNRGSWSEKRVKSDNSCIIFFN